MESRARAATARERTRFLDLVARCPRQAERVHLVCAAFPALVADVAAALRAVEIALLKRMTA